MSVRLLLLPEALVDMEKASEWYASKSLSLHQGFLADLELSMDRILAFPKSSPAYRTNVRRTLLGKFPFGIFYKVDEEVVKIMAVFHLKQDLDKLSSRIHWVSAPS